MKHPSSYDEKNRRRIRRELKKKDVSRRPFFGSDARNQYHQDFETDEE